MTELYAWLLIIILQVQLDLNHLMLHLALRPSLCHPIQPLLSLSIPAVVLCLSQLFVRSPLQPLFHTLPHQVLILLSFGPLVGTVLLRVISLVVGVFDEDVQVLVSVTRPLMSVERALL